MVMEILMLGTFRTVWQRTRAALALEDRPRDSEADPTISCRSESVWSVRERENVSIHDKWATFGERRRTVLLWTKIHSSTPSASVSLHQARYQNHLELFLAWVAFYLCPATWDRSLRKADKAPQLATSSGKMESATLWRCRRRFPR
jgi:hypothetical protein